MRRVAILFCLIGSLSTTVKSQEHKNEEKPEKIYEVNLKVDIPIALAGSALTAYGFKLISEKEGSTPEQVNALNFEQDVSGFNRLFGEPRYSEAASNTSDILFYGAFPLGVGLLADKASRSDFWTIMVMYWEALAITGTIYAQTAAHVDKYRPLAYPGSGAPLGERTEDGAKNSFPGGHPTITATATFFIAKVLSDNNPDRKGLKIAAYSTASALTLTNAYLRWKAGKHFASDLLVGLTYSTAIGILVPEFHKISRKNDRLSLYSGPNGMTLSYKLE
ncbi:MAG: phosphatase PAP2 family protein [Candidatus Cyclobacteriaceae bacterium M2_1C_046]